MMDKGRELETAFAKLKQEHQMLQEQHQQVNSKYQTTLHELDGVLANLQIYGVVTDNRMFEGADLSERAVQELKEYYIKRAVETRTTNPNYLSEQLDRKICRLKLLRSEITTHNAKIPTVKACVEVLNDMIGANRLVVAETRELEEVRKENKRKIKLLQERDKQLAEGLTRASKFRKLSDLTFVPIHDNDIHKVELLKDWRYAKPGHSVVSDLLDDEAMEDPRTEEEIDRDGDL